MQEKFGKANTQLGLRATLWFNWIAFDLRRFLRSIFSICENEPLPYLLVLFMVQLPVGITS